MEAVAAEQVATAHHHATRPRDKASDATKARAAPSDSRTPATVAALEGRRTRATTPASEDHRTHAAAALEDVDATTTREGWAPGLGKGEERPEWKCDQCSSHNFLDRAECRNCRGPRPESVQTPTRNNQDGRKEWLCIDAQCRGRCWNYLDRDRCRGCGQPRPQSVLEGLSEEEQAQAYRGRNRFNNGGGRDTGGFSFGGSPQRDRGRGGGRGFGGRGGPPQESRAGGNRYRIEGDDDAVPPSRRPQPARTRYPNAPTIPLPAPAGRGGRPNIPLPGASSKPKVPLPGRPNVPLPGRPKVPLPTSSSRPNVPLPNTGKPSVPLPRRRDATTPSSSEYDEPPPVALPSRSAPSGPSDENKEEGQRRPRRRRERGQRQEPEPAKPTTHKGYELDSDDSDDDAAAKPAQPYSATAEDIAAHMSKGLAGAELERR